jgi:hypothetical protein
MDARSDAPCTADRPGPAVGSAEVRPGGRLRAPAVRRADAGPRRVP